MGSAESAETCPSESSTIEDKETSDNLRSAPKAAVVVDAEAVEEASASVDNDGSAAVCPPQREPQKPNSGPAKAAADKKTKYKERKKTAELVKHILVSLGSCRRGTQLGLEPAAIMAAFKKNPVYSLTDLYDLLQLETRLFTIFGGRVTLALTDSHNDAAFYDRLCEFHQVPYLADNQSGAEQFSPLFERRVLPPAPSRGHAFSVEEPGRLLVSGLQMVLHHREEGTEGRSHRAFFTFHTIIFFLDLDPADWAAVKGNSVTTGFLYFLGSGIKLLPQRYTKMESLWKQRTARLR
jgi:hypothetical protein